VAVVNELIAVLPMEYAVIEALQTEPGSERFVIAYRNEQSLREVIAAPCIFAFGFSSREEAVASTKACVSSCGLETGPALL